MADKRSIIAQLITDGLDAVERRYGPTGTHPLAYHNVVHAREVMEACQLMGDKAALDSKIAADDVPLLVLAACYHDIEHGLANGQNEIESARILAQKMHATHAFNGADIQTTTDLILATIVHMQGGQLQQSATDNYLTKIMADADVSNFGQPFQTFWQRTQAHRQEYGERINKAFIRSEIALLQRHRFYTPEAAEVFPYKADNIACMQSLLQDIKKEPVALQALLVSR